MTARGTLNLSVGNHHPASQMKRISSLSGFLRELFLTPPAHRARSRAPATNKILLSCDDTSSAFVDSKYCF